MQSMSVDVETWRGRIGCFPPRRIKGKFKPANLILQGTSLRRKFQMWLYFSLLMYLSGNTLYAQDCISMSNCVTRNYAFGQYISACDCYGEPHITRWLELCADVESNPGPGSRGKGQGSRGKAGRTTRQSKLPFGQEDEMESDSDGSAENIAILKDIQSEMKGLNRKFDRMREEFREDYDGLKRENSELKRRIEDLEYVVNSTEAQSRRNNVVIQGLSATLHETWEETEKIVRAFLYDNLNIANQHEFVIERAHRLGKKITSPIIVKFLSFRDKMTVMSAARNARDTCEARVMNDFTDKTRKQRSTLIPHMIRAREQGKKAYLAYDKLVVEKVSSRLGHVYRVRVTGTMSVTTHAGVAKMMPQSVPTARIIHSVMKPHPLVTRGIVAGVGQEGALE